MRQPSILDVVRAVKDVATTHPEVASWWYAPPQRLRLAGEQPGSGAPVALVELAVEMNADCVPSCEAIARELSRSLRGAPVHVRRYRGDLEPRRLFRLASQDGRLSA
jgi:hypothetical protein